MKLRAFRTNLAPSGTDFCARTCNRRDARTRNTSPSGKKVREGDRTRTWFCVLKVKFKELKIESSFTRKRKDKLSKILCLVSSDLHEWRNDLGTVSERDSVK